MGKPGDTVTAERTLLRLTFFPFAMVTVSLPAVSLAICFITAFLFRHEDVNETMCSVKNYIPSISAVTGITPQTYVWRIGIALHSAPRFAVAYIHYNYYLTRMQFVKESRRDLFRKLIRLNFWLNTIENSCLVCVSYISNRENYPIHEKIFVVFMTASLMYMLCNTICFSMSRGPILTRDEMTSYFWKKLMFVSNFSATAGLLYFFAKHRLYCQPGAFSYFSLCEYVIAYTNMGYHVTAYLDFNEYEWMVAVPTYHARNGTALLENNNDHEIASTSTPNGVTTRRRR